MKILYITTIGSTMGFFKRYIKRLIDNGNIVDIATNDSEGDVPKCYQEWGCRIFHISTSRSPCNVGNFIAIGQIRKIAQNYNIVHCHTPLAAVATRIACIPLRHKGLKVFYTAHGFHFYKGAPLKNWIIYYPIELLCSKWTDVLITINDYDYSIASKHFYAKSTYKVNGVGIDIDKYKSNKLKRTKKRQELGIPEDTTMYLSVGMLQKDKNHISAIKALQNANNQNYRYYICGTGLLEKELKGYIVENSLSDKVFLLGYRNDVADLLSAADFFLFPSIFEGLAVSVMEACAAMIPVIGSTARGVDDLIADSMCKCKWNSITDLTEIINNLCFRNNDDIVKHNWDRINNFSYEVVEKQLLKIYSSESF